MRFESISLQFSRTVPPTKASPAPLVSTISLWSISRTGNVSTLSPVEKTVHSKCERVKLLLGLKNEPHSQTGCLAEVGDFLRSKIDVFFAKRLYIFPQKLKALFHFKSVKCRFKAAKIKASNLFCQFAHLVSMMLITYDTRNVNKLSTEKRWRSFHKTCRKEQKDVPFSLDEL